MADHAWADALREERARRGWSLGMVARKMVALARELNIADMPHWDHVGTTVQHYEAGRRKVGGWKYYVLLAGVYGIPIAELFGEEAARKVPAGYLGVTGGTVEIPHFTRAEDDPMERRKLTQWLAALGATTSLPAPVMDLVRWQQDVPDTLPWIEMEDVHRLEEVLDGFKTIERSVGGGAMRHAVNGVLGFAVHQIEARVQGGSEAVCSWRVTTARLANHAGFMASDAGREALATRYYLIGYRIAARTDHWRADGIRAHILFNLGRQAVWMRRPKTALELHRFAATLTDELPALDRARLHGSKARAFANTGDLSRVQREIGFAEREYGQVTPDDRLRSPWNDKFTAADIRFDRATAQHVILRDHPDAASKVDPAETVRGFQSAADAWHDGGMARNRTHSQIRAASVLFLSKEPREAVRVAREALATLSTLRSARINDDVRELASVAGPFRRNPDVRDLIHDLETTV